MQTETFWSLLRSTGHWEFEIFLMILFDLLLGGLLWPFLRKHWKHHVRRDEKDAQEFMNDFCKQGSSKFSDPPCIDGRGMRAKPRLPEDDR